MDAINQAIASIEGGQAALARVLNITPQQVNQWAKGGRPVPARYVLAIEQATGVSRHLLCPDIFGSAPSAAEETSTPDHQEAA